MVGFETVLRVLFLEDYNTRLVILTTVVLGAACGLTGTFLLLRKSSLMGDALSHACLPGIGIAFLVMVAAGGSGKALGGLLAGAILTGALGVGTVLLIRNTSRIKEDAAMGIVLSVGFGIGVAVLGMVQSVPETSAAGLESFIYGKTASMVMADFQVLAGVAGLVLVVSLIFLKEFVLICFDEDYGRALGFPVGWLNGLMLALVTLVTVAGLQAVGLILIIAFLITPAAAARFWTEDLRMMALLAMGIGALSGWIGAGLSALLPGLPAGAIIVLVATGFFGFSLLFGTARGVVTRERDRYRLQRRVGRQHLLRAVYEVQEKAVAADGRPVANVPVSFGSVLGKRSWSSGRLRGLIRRAKVEDHIEAGDQAEIALSESGFGEASRITRNHRLWETYLIKHADIAASHVDRDADAVEHVLSPEMVRKLERELDAADRIRSPHPLGEGEEKQ